VRGYRDRQRQKQNGKLHDEISVSERNNKMRRHCRVFCGEMEFWTQHRIMGRTSLLIPLGSARSM
jgi:hypothetical protein